MVKCFFYSNSFIINHCNYFPHQLTYFSGTPACQRCPDTEKNNKTPPPPPTKPTMASCSHKVTLVPAFTDSKFFKLEIRHRCLFVLQNDT